MKKIALFACAAVLALASCGNKTAQNAENVDSTVVEAVAQTVTDSVISMLKEQVANADPQQVKVALAQLQTTYAQLVQEGKLEDAKQYATAIQQYISENSETIKKIANGDATINSLLEGVQNLPTSADVTAAAALAAVQSDAKTIASQAVDQATDAAKAAVDAKVNEAKDAAKSAAEAKMNEVKSNVASKVSDAVKKANETKSSADAAKSKADEKASQAKATVDAAKKLLGK